MVIVALASLPAMAETPEEWIVLGTRIHGGFGAFIPVGIRIGLDALQRLNANQREVTVLYYDSDKAPCACIADGVAIATIASVGQRTLQIAPDKAPSGTIAVIIIRHKQTGKAVQYTVGDDLLPKIVDWNRSLDSRGRYEAVMAADKLFQAMPVN
jgi:formylmethanofuran dehydrogenase subunit E